jgi:CheY-like chemotaxis protein
MLPWCMNGLPAKMGEVALKICMVDDDRIYQFAARKAMEALNCADHLSSFGNGQEALTHLKRLALQEPAALPDLIFVDLNMPVMDGWAFLEALSHLLHEWKRKPTVYVVSSSIDDKDIVRSRSYHHVADYLVKPVHKERFRQVIAQHSRPPMRVLQGGL